jgi:hypothetical protein
MHAAKLFRQLQATRTTLSQRWYKKKKRELERKGLVR